MNSVSVTPAAAHTLSTVYSAVSKHFPGEGGGKPNVPRIKGGDTRRGGYYITFQGGVGECPLSPLNAPLVY